MSTNDQPNESGLSVPYPKWPGPPPKTVEEMREYRAWVATTDRWYVRAVKEKAQREAAEATARRNAYDKQNGWTRPPEKPSRAQLAADKKRLEQIEKTEQKLKRLALRGEARRLARDARYAEKVRQRLARKTQEKTPA